MDIFCSLVLHRSSWRSTMLLHTPTGHVGDKRPDRRVKRKTARRGVRDVECARRSSLSHRCVMHRQCPVSSNHYSYPSFYIQEYPGLITSSRRVCYPFRFHLSTNQMMMRSRARTHTPALLWTHTEHGWSIFYKFIAVKRRLSSEPKTKKNNEKAMRVSPVQ